MEPVLRSAQVLKQEAEDIGLPGEDVAEYVTRQQTLDREEWRDTQKMQAQANIRAEAKDKEKKCADDIWMAEKQADVQRL